PTTAGSGVSFDANAKSSIEGEVETGQYFGILDFANIAAMIEKNNGTVFWIAGEWKAFADIWRSSVQNFIDAVGYVFKNQYWEGAGADRAVAFLDKYLQSTDTLHRGMISMSNVIGNTADFNAFVWSHLPRYDQLDYHSDGSVAKVIDTAADVQLPRVQTFWDSGDDTSGQKGYVAGIKQLAGYIPVFTDPNKLAGANGDLPGTYNYKQPTGDNNGGGGGNGRGGGTGGGGGGKPGGSGGGKGSGEGGGTGSGGGKPNDGPGGAGKSGIDPQSSSRAPSSGSATAAPGGATGPLSALSKALQQLASGAMSGPWDLWASGPWGVSGPTGASGPFGFDISPARAGGGSPGGGSPAKPANPVEDKLFPRAGSSGNATETVDARASMSPSAAMPYGGYPMGGGMGGAPGGQQQQQQRKRAAYLDSTEHLEEAVGEDPLSVRPVIDR
ncbi:hypothetical protein ACWDPW_34610, partial [Nocardia xishanensis]